MISIRRYKSSDAMAAAYVIRSTFGKFNQDEGPKSAVKKYLGFYDPSVRGLERIAHTFERTPIFYVALDKGKVIGIVRGEKDHLINFFVLGSYHGMGVGRRLINKFHAEAHKRGSTEVRTSASMYAVPVYESFGYKKTTGVRKLKRLGGIMVQPMRKTLK